VSGFCNAIGEAAALARFCSLYPERMVLVLACDDRPEIRLAAFSHGADDVMAAGGDPREIDARVAALTRRASEAARPIAHGPLSIDPLARLVEREGRQIPMPGREFDLLLYLARRPDCYVSTATLRRRVWGIEHDPGTNSVAVHVSRLRSRIDHGFAWSMLRSAREMGYALASAPGFDPGS
ncbi:MAG: response regulator transcription factor, partial [Sphingomonadales bacterium]|nr:response regulator transcription factor [Sphingomonadales bacterium]